MKIDHILTELETLAKAVGVRLSYEAIGGELGAGGLCKLKGEWRAIIDRRATTSERVSVLAQALGRVLPQQLPADLVVSDPVRDLLEKSRPRVPAEAPGASGSEPI